MDWSKIKAIFIISFFILDVYLLYEFIKMLDYHEYDVYSQVESASIESKLNEKEIKYVTLPENYTKDFILSAKPKKFTPEDTHDSILGNQRIDINDIELASQLDEPLKITEKFDTAELNDFIEDHVLYGDQYHFVEKDADNLTITYRQHYKGHELFENENGTLIFHIEDNKIVSYKQTYLEGIEELSDPKTVIQPIKAIQVLYESGDLKPKSEITKVEFGYYTLITQLLDPVSDTTQVLNPAWYFEIDDGEKKLFVDALNGKKVDLEIKDKETME